MNPGTGSKISMKHKFNRNLIISCFFIAGTTIGGFAVLRFVSGDKLIGAIDVIIALIFLAIGYNTYRTESNERAIYLCAIMAIIGTLTTLHFNSVTGVYWAFVITIVVFYVFPYRHAFAFAAVTVLGSCLLLSINSNYFHILTFLATDSLICLFSFLFALGLERKNRELELLSLRDEMTGIGNRRAFAGKIKEVINLYNRVELPASLIYFDVDNFKSINDTLGHATGDIALTTIAELTKSNLRETDSIFRIGGDEFVIIAEGADQNAASLVAEKLRTNIQCNEIISGRILTISLGVSVIKKGDTSDSWISRADNALYQAKKTGRNRVEKVS